MTRVGWPRTRPGRRFQSIIGSLVFLLLAPGIVAGLIPLWIARGESQPPLLGISALRVVGILAIAAGLPLVLDSFARFALQGLGTPAPVVPTQRLVVTGLYRFVRNPMYVGVVSIIVGQGLLLGDARVLAYGAAIWICSHAFVLAYEEPTLRRQFGAEYDELTRHVPRWIPRLRPWRGQPRARQR